MSNRKTEFRFFDVMDFEKEADYLSEMHARGWKFVHVGFPGIYHFVKCQPEQVRYQLDYNHEGTAHIEEYQQMFADMGWEYMFDFVGYSYFRKPVNEMEGDADEEIFCDDDSRWDMMKRVFQGRIIPLIVIFAAVIIPQIAISIRNLGFPNGLAVLMIILGILYISIFIRFAVKFQAFKKKLGR